MSHSSSLLLIETAFFPEKLVKLAAMSVLKYQEDALAIMEPTIKTQYIGMAKTSLNLHLSLQLSVNSVFLDLFLKKHLQRHDVFGLEKNHKAAIGSIIADNLENRKCCNDLEGPGLLWQDKPFRICLCPVAFRSRSLATRIAHLEIEFRSRIQNSPLMLIKQQ